MFQAIRHALPRDRCDTITEPRGARLADRVATLVAEPRQRHLDPRRLGLFGDEFWHQLNVHG